VDRIDTGAAQHRHHLCELARAQPGERGYPRRLRCRDHTSHSKIIRPLSVYDELTGTRPFNSTAPKKEAR
jgi:hypothetical protein